MKLEQASKVKSWKPTQLQDGEGRADREESDGHVFRSTGVMSTASQEGYLGNWGRAGTGGVRIPNVVCKDDGQADRWIGS